MGLGGRSCVLLIRGGQSQLAHLHHVRAGHVGRQSEGRLSALRLAHRVEVLRPRVPRATKASGLTAASSWAALHPTDPLSAAGRQLDARASPCSPLRRRVAAHGVLAVGVTFRRSLIDCTSNTSGVCCIRPAHAGVMVHRRGCDLLGGPCTVAPRRTGHRRASDARCVLFHAPDEDPFYACPAGGHELLVHRPGWVVERRAALPLDDADASAGHLGQQFGRVNGSSFVAVPCFPGNPTVGR